MSFWKVTITALFYTFFTIMAYNILSEFGLDSIMFQWSNHSPPVFKFFGPLMNIRYGTKMSKQDMIDEDIFTTGTNNKTL